MTATIADTLRTGYTGIIVRPLFGLVIALVVTASLFWIMQNLIDTADRSLNHESVGTLLEFVRVQRDETPIRKVPKPEIPPKPEQQPPQPPMSTLEDPNLTMVEVAVAPAPVEPGFKMKNTFNLGAEGDYLPIVKVAPIYPNQALRRGLEGYCVVEYTVTRLGTIKDPTIVKDQCSSNLFYSSSINAALKFKYKPRIVDGIEVEVTGVQNKFSFKIVE